MATRVCLGLLFLLATAASAAAQGPGSELDDPRGGPARPRQSASPRAAGGAATGDEAVPAPPDGYGSARSEDGYGVPQSDSPRSTADAEVADRLRALDATYMALSNTGGINWGSVIPAFIGGAASIGFGIGFLELGEPWEFLSPYLIVLGGSTIVRTIVSDLILRPDPQPVAIEYQNMPYGNRADRLARLRYGEQQLDRLAQQAFVARIVDASLSIAGALAVVPAYLLPRDLSTFQPIEALIFIGPAISLIMAIVTLATPTTIERRRDAYVQMRARFAERRRSNVEVGASAWIDPLGGGGLVVGGRY